jgi:hypothetical protein
MIGRRWCVALLVVLWAASSAGESSRPYVLMENDLADLKAGFNEAVDQVRLVFIVGPT